jgi:gamma-glutamyl hercynylcysteine S-oxide synthase
MTNLGFTPQLSHTVLIDTGRRARSFGRAKLGEQLAAVRRYLREYVASLTEAQLQPPMATGINPPLWEAAHVAWFAEWWCVRDAYNTEDGETRADIPSLWADCDHFLNSNLIAHNARWRLPQVTRAATLDYLDRSLDATLSRLEKSQETDDALYPFRLALFHEAMHLEAVAWCAQTLAWPRPAWVRPLQDLHRPGEIAVSTQRGPIGHDAGGFSFDNERTGFAISLADFTIDHTPVSNAQFLQFVESGEYLARTGNAHPCYWRESHAGWQVRSFDAWQSLDLRAPVVHVSAVEADTYCHWAGRRLPTEHEWETAAQRDFIEWGEGVWEWTSSTFAPYAGFSADRYREYSAPWFDGKHRVLRGGSFATLAIVHHASYRNFFLPHRSDVFAGFRTVALST